MMRKFTKRIVLGLIATVPFGQTNAQAPANNLCSGAMPLNVNTTYTPTLSTNVGAVADTSDISLPFNCGNSNFTYYSSDVWYYFIATANNATIYLPNTSVSSINPNATYYTYALGVYSGTDCSNLMYVTCAVGNNLGGAQPLTAGLTIPNVVEGQKYYIRFFENLAATSSVIQIPDDRSLKFSIGVTSTVATPLAINLASIQAKNAGLFNVVSWEMAQGDEIGHFEVERSNDGKTFQYLNKIEGSPKLLSYDFNDNAPFAGVNYYRLKMIDKAGEANYSKVVSANAPSNTESRIQVYPNPTHNNVKIKVQDSKDGIVKLTDITGKELLHKPVTNMETDINMSPFPTGIYFIQYVNKDYNQVVKIIRQ